MAWRSPAFLLSRPGFTPQQLDGARRRARVGEVRAAAVIAMAVRGSREPGVGSGCWGVHQTCEPGAGERA